MSKVVLIFILVLLFFCFRKQKEHFTTVINYPDDPNINNNSIYQIHWIGRFGNRMFQYAFGCHQAKKNNCYFQFPSKWEGTFLFKPVLNSFPIYDTQLRNDLADDKPLIGSSGNSKNRFNAIKRFEKRNDISLKHITTNNINKPNEQKINVYYDDLHMMYFPSIYNEYDPEFIKSIFQFNDDVVNSELFQEKYRNRGTYDCAHVRRGEIVSKNYKGAHSAVSMESYYKEMKKQGINPKKVIYVSDDSNVKTKTKWDKYCKGGWSYPVGQHKLDKVFFDWFPDFLTMYFARKLFRGNSSISWWAGFLGDCEVYAPILKKRITSKGKNFMDCDFVKGNHPPFMGIKEEGMFQDIKFLGLSA